MCADAPAARQTDAETLVDRSVVIHAKPATVFRFFSDPVRFARWWGCPGGGMATIDPRPGGEVRIAYHGGGAVMLGRVVELVPDERFVFTWGYEKGNDAVPPGTSRVEVSLSKHPEGTLLRLRHLGLPNTEQVKGHNTGWRHYLAVVAAECAREAHTGAAELVALWFEAWNEGDDGTRLGLLRRCTDDETEFRDAFTAVVGASEINAHIANSRRHMPGITLKAEGPVSTTHGYARAQWSMGPVPGMGIVRGENVFRFSPHGPIRSVIGFWEMPAK